MNILIDRLSSLSVRTLVWSHFCLCYEGQKLIHDVASIKKYGIKDGDQVWSGFRKPDDYVSEKRFSCKSYSTMSSF